MTLHGRLHLMPLKKDKLNHVLDFGTGTGIWAIEFGMTELLNVDSTLRTPSTAISQCQSNRQRSQSHPTRIVRLTFP
jgi:methylase of polypeptide subunit release factors